MASFLKENRKMVLSVLISLILLVNVCVYLSSKVSDYLHQSATDIVGAQAVDAVSFCVDKNYFKDSPPFILDSIDTASENMFDSFVLDTYLTKDGKTVCVPQENLKSIIGEKGTVGSFTYYDLLQHDLLFKGKKTGSPILLCEDMIFHCTEISVTPVVYPHNIDSAHQIEFILKSYEHSGMIIVMSDDFSLICEIAEKYPLISLWYKVDEVTDEIIESMNVVKKVEIIFNSKNSKNDEETVEKLKQAEIPFGCYDLNSRKALKKYISLGVSDIITSKFVKV